MLLTNGTIKRNNAYPAQNAKFHLTYKLLSTDKNPRYFYE